MRHVAMWIDSENARVFHLGGVAFEETTVHSVNHPADPRPLEQAAPTGDCPDYDPSFFDEVIQVLDGGEDVLIVGHSVAKQHFVRYAKMHAPALSARVVDV